MNVNESRPLVERVGSGLSADATADEWVRAAYDTHATKIYGLAIAASRDADVAADITQEAFLRLLAEVRGGRYPNNAGGWLYRVASNLLMSRGRRLSVARRLAHRVATPETAVDTPESVALGHAEQRALRAALDRLNVLQRTAVIMAAQGLTSDEIGAHLGKTNGAIRTVLFRARGQLRRDMDREGVGR